MDIQGVLKELIHQSLKKLGKENRLNLPSELSCCKIERKPRGQTSELTITLDSPKDKKFGDYTTNIAFSLGRINSLKPHEIAQLIRENFQNFPQSIERVEVVNGYLNFYLSSECFQELIGEIIKKGENFADLDIGKNEKVQIEFVSANPTGPLHIGHGRGAAIGSALANIMEKAGYQVHKEYYINDMGTQMEILGKSLALRLREVYGERISIPDDYYQGEYLYKMAEENRDMLKDRLEDWQYIASFASELILDEIKKDLKDFGVEHDSFVAESSFYKSKKVDKVLGLLKERGLLYKQDGAFWLKSTQFSDEKDRVVIRKDGKPTYLTSDIAYHQDKIERGFHKVINIWGADHHGYISRLKAALKGLGYEDEQVHFILVQMVRLFRGKNPVQMSTRKGAFVTLREVMEEVGKDAARFFFLLRKADTHLDFDLELAKKESPENPVYYVQYAHARICSILKKFREMKKELPKTVKYELLEDEKEMNLMRKLEKFPSVIRKCAENLQPHHITNYLYEVASEFHHFYDHLRVLTENDHLTFARLNLCLATKTILREGLSLLGIGAPEKM
ncbi:MAG TPA: arginine--tRNA ligase [Candidatus Omnitrophica bacterium]|nr:arginine--tRNA ligase [Candidatus Omnitrophota bacterium]